MIVIAACNIEKDFADLALERTSLSTLAKDRLQRVQTFKSLLEREKSTSAQLQQSLKKANEELQWLMKEK